MPQQPRESIRLLQEAIRKKRVEIGLPPEGKLDPRTVAAALREKPPIEEIVAYVKNALKENPRPQASPPSDAAPEKPFDKMA